MVCLCSGSSSFCPSIAFWPNLEAGQRLAPVYPPARVYPVLDHRLALYVPIDDSVIFSGAYAILFNATPPHELHVYGMALFHALAFSLYFGLRQWRASGPYPQTHRLHMVGPYADGNCRHAVLWWIGIRGQSGRQHESDDFVL